MESESALYEKIVTLGIALIGLAAAIIFGIFSVFSWLNSQTAKEQANSANLFALAQLCDNNLVWRCKFFQNRLLR